MAPFSGWRMYVDAWQEKGNGGICCSREQPTGGPPFGFLGGAGYMCVPAEINKQIVAVYGNVMNRQNVTKWCREFFEGRTDVHDEQRSGRPSLISGEARQAANFYDSGIQKLVVT